MVLVSHVRVIARKLRKKFDKLSAAAYVVRGKIGQKICESRAKMWFNMQNGNVVTGNEP